MTHGISATTGVRNTNSEEVFYVMAMPLKKYSQSLAFLLPKTLRLTTLLLLSTSANAGIVVWDTNSNGFWNQGSRWSNGVVPGIADDVILSRAGVDPLVTLYGNPYEVNSLIVDDRLNFADHGQLTVHTDAMLNGLVSMIGASHLVVNGNLFINNVTSLSEGSAITVGTATIISNTLNLETGSIFNNNGVLSINGAMNAVQPTLNLGSGSIFNNKDRKSVV